MEFEIHPEVLDELVALARTIAQGCQYPVLIAELPPAMDHEVEVAGQRRMSAGMATKWQKEIEKMREASFGHDRIWQISQLGRICALGACLDAVAPSQVQAYWWMATCLRLASVYGFSQEEVEAAALAQYRVRARRHAEMAEEQEIAEENAAIQAAIDALPWPGFPIGEMAERYGVSAKTLYDAIAGGHLTSRRATTTVLIKKDQRWFDWLARHRTRKRE